METKKKQSIGFYDFLLFGSLLIMVIVSSYVSWQGGIMEGRYTQCAESGLILIKTLDGNLDCTDKETIREYYAQKGYILDESNPKKVKLIKNESFTNVQNLENVYQ